MTVSVTTDRATVPMPTRPLGRTGWNASVLTLGGVKWDTFIPEAEAVRLIQRAIELGVNCIDTAASYGEGRSETRLGLALQGLRDRVFVSTKTGKRDYDGARREVNQSLERLRTDYIDLYLVHGLDNDEDYAKVASRTGVLRALEEYKAAGQVRHIGVSGHWYRHNMRRIIDEYPFDAILCPVGLFNLAYNYSYIEDVVPAARQRGMAIMGMKVMGAGRAKHAASIEPYMRYSLHQPYDTLVIGCESIEQLEQLVEITKRQPPPLSQDEIAALLPEAIRITQKWDKGEFNWVKHYIK